MKHVAIALAAFIIHTALTAVLSLAYNPLTEPLDLAKLSLDLGLFAAIYAVLWHSVEQVVRLGAKRRRR